MKYLEIFKITYGEKYFKRGMDLYLDYLKETIASELEKVQQSRRIKKVNL